MHPSNAVTTRLAMAVGSATLVLLSAGTTAAMPATDAARADLLLVVDCLLPGQVRSLGQRTVYVSARRPARLTARDCQIRGGEFVAYDRADQRSALAAWLPLAEQGDLEAQVIVGEIHERGIGVAPDHAAAASWYLRAAQAGSARAQVNLGYLYERGLGVAADPHAALDWYRRAAGREATVELDPALPPPAVQAAPPPTTVAPADDRIAVLEASIARLESELAAAQAALQDAEARETVAQLQRQLAAEREEALRLQRELEAERRESGRLAAEAAAATNLASGQQQRIAALEASVQERLLAGPQIAIVEPAVVPTRDIVPVALAPGDRRQVIGRVSAPAGVASVTVNDAAVAVNENGLFSTTIPLAAGDSPVRVVAVDRQGKRDELRFVLRADARGGDPAVAAGVTPGGTAAGGVDFGSYHALLIGNNDYRQLPDLASPINDVTEIARLLERRYGFRSTVLVNADRYQILSALNALREQLTSRDNLLIYFAGHGELDAVNQRSHWLPVDAERDSSANWIPTTAVTDILNIMKAKQVLLVVDSCYAGALTRSASGRLRTGMTDEERLHWYRTMAGKRSRTVLTSGGVAPVMDAGGGRHSVFARALLEVLDASGDTLDGQRLYREVAARVAYAAAGLRFDQVPEYAPIRHAGHEAGEFFLVPRR